MSGPKATRSNLVFQTKPKLYIVDDEPMLLELAIVILEPLGFEISTFRDPEVALNAFSRANPRPDLLITDYAMHHMNGMELIQQCRRIQPNQKILLISGTVGMEIFHQSSSKPDRYLAKPYQARQLVDLVRAMLSS
jgi:DNA-binding response OmpR family regulator